MSSQRRLGRGLEALLGRSLDQQDHPPVPQARIVDTAIDSAVVEVAADGVMTRDADGQRWLELGVIEPNPYQPRKSFDEVEIADLADSIKAHGMMQPLVIRRIDGRFQLVAGERRLRAAQMLGWERVPVQVRDLEERQTAELALVENLQRKDLNAIEKAASFDRYLRDYDCTQEELAARVHINRSTVANLVRLLDLPQDVQQMVVAGDLTQGHARALLSLPAEQQGASARKVVAEGLSVRATERLVQDAGTEPAEPGLRVVGEDGTSRPQPAARSAQLGALEAELAAALGTKVTLTQNAKGAGKVTIAFTDADAFERVRALLTAPAPPARAAA